MDHKLQSELIRSLRRREKGYSDHPADKGGPTMDGVAEATARRYGYQGDMRDIPSSLIDSIYIDLYWAPLNLDTLSALSTRLARMEERQNVTPPRRVSRRPGWTITPSASGSLKSPLL